VFQRFRNGQGVELRSTLLAVFQNAAQVMPRNFNRQRIGDDVSGLLLVLLPGRVRQRDPNRPAVDKKLYVHGISMAGGNGHDDALKDTMDRSTGPTLDGAEVFVHVLETLVREKQKPQRTAAQNPHILARIAYRETKKLAFQISRLHAKGETDIRYNRRVSMQKKSPSGGQKASALKTQRAKRDRERATKRPLKTPAVQILTSEKLEQIPWLVHGFSTRPGGVSKAYGGGQLNLGFTAEDTKQDVERNRTRFMRKLKAVDAAGESWPLVLLNQVHSAAIHRVYGARGPEWARLRKGHVVATSGDGLITNTPGVLLGVKVADCFPVIVADRKKEAVGVFHAGWRGTVQRIVEKGVGEMQRQFGCKPENLMAVIGPGIGGCCYEIGDEVESAFETQFAYSKELFEDVFDSWSLKTKYPLLFLNQRAPGHGEQALSRHLDLVKANWCQLLDAGVPEENIQSMELCTSCRTDLFFSYRKEQVTGRMLAVVGVR